MLLAPQGRRLQDTVDSDDPYTAAVSQCQATVETLIVPVMVRNAVDALHGMAYDRRRA